MIIVIFIRALRNLLLPDILKLFLFCLLAYVIGWGVLWWGFTALIAAYIGFAGSDGFVVHIMSGIGGSLLAWLLFPLLYPILVSFFDDEMAAAIEQEDYPQLPKAVPPFWPTILNDLVFALKAISLNLLILPLFLVPPVYAVIYYGLNGYLLGTQFFRIVAGRRASAAEAEILQKKARHTIFLAGIAISFSATIPVLNLAAPLLGIAAMLHLFHALKGTPRQDALPPPAEK